MSIESLPRAVIDPALDWQPACDLSWLNQFDKTVTDVCGQPAVYAADVHTFVGCWRHKFLCAECRDALASDDSECRFCGDIAQGFVLRNEVRI